MGSGMSGLLVFLIMQIAGLYHHAWLRRLNQIRNQAPPACDRQKLTFAQLPGLFFAAAQADHRAPVKYYEGKIAMSALQSLQGFLSTQPVIDFMTNILAAICVLVVTFLLSRWVKSSIAQLGFKYDQLDDTLFVFLSKFSQIVVIIVGATFVLNSFGVQTTSIVALLGAAGLAVGLALQGTLSNFAAGIMLIVFRPFKQGDFVSVSGQSGTVKEISIFTTELATTDNLQVIVPNGQVWGAPITNYSVYDKRRLDLVFSVSYGTDLARADAVLTDLVAGDTRIHKAPDPLIKVSALNQSSVDFTLRLWCDASDYLTLKFDLTRRVKEAFDVAGIEIPFPTTMIINSNDPR